MDAEKGEGAGGGGEIGAGAARVGAGTGVGEAEAGCLAEVQRCHVRISRRGVWGAGWGSGFFRFLSRSHLLEEMRKGGGEAAYKLAVVGRSGAGWWKGREGREARNGS